MYTVEILKRDEEETLIKTRNFEENQKKAENYFNLLKMDMRGHTADEYYDETEELRYSDIKIVLKKDDKIISYSKMGK